MAWPTTVPTFTAGAVLLASKLNDLRDALNAIGSQWTAYTPVITASTTDPTLGATVVTGRYRITGKTADVHVNITIGTGWSGGAGLYRISLPTAVVPYITNASNSIGTGTVRDVSPSVATYLLGAYYVTTTSFSAIVTGSTTPLSGVAPVTFASGDMISFHLANLEIA